METEESLAVKIKKTEGEQTRVFLRNHNLLKSNLKIKRSTDYLFIPVKESIKDFDNFNLVTDSFEKTKQSISTYQHLLNLPIELQSQLPTSFDIIGDIILLKLPKELQSYSKEIGHALLKTHAHVNTVCTIDPVSGELRRRNVHVIAGKQKTVTNHKEYGLWFKVDVEKTYFSSRLATERKRISNLIEKNAFVYDMFCGVAPFSIMIAKYAQPKQVIAVDKNHDAIKLAQHNIQKNNVSNNTIAIHEDALNTKQILSYHKIIPTHIIMNLPFSAFEFFPLALQVIKNNGMIHYYDMIDENSIEKRIDQLKSTAQKYDSTLLETTMHKIKTYAPHEFYIGIDITVSKK
ncbi:MAG: class I SAM-dependent methyltransferase family protein [Candidatus Thermoplasmatota archaeon]|nr:class I SAM-dependent methyltransferase family protein [Candidatus Thermoplasmatota archaeon]